MTPEEKAIVEASRVRLNVVVQSTKHAPCSGREASGRIPPARDANSRSVRCYDPSRHPGAEAHRNGGLLVGEALVRHRAQAAAEKREAEERGDGRTGDSAER